MPMLFEDSLPAEVSANPKGGEMDLVATHQRLLVCGALQTQGTILELGVGWYSTPLLHEISKAQKRRLITIDNNPYWLNQFRNLQNPYHTFIDIGWWGEMQAEDHYGLVFVDNGQPIEREYCIRKLINRADLFVMHDTEEHFAYGYNRTLPMFKYAWTDKCQKIWTTIASNVINVEEEFSLIQLPSVEPSQEVT